MAETKTKAAVKAVVAKVPAVKDEIKKEKSITSYKIFELTRSFLHKIRESPKTLSYYEMLFLYTLSLSLFSLHED